MHHLTLHQLCVSASPCHISLLFLFFNNTAPPEIYTLSLHDALPIASHLAVMRTTLLPGLVQTLRANLNRGEAQDRKSTRLNSSHTVSSYAVFCLKKKKAKTSTKS